MPILGRAIRGTSITRPGKIWLPQLRDVVKTKIEIDNQDVTADVLQSGFTWPTLRNGLGFFNLQLNNDTRKYLEIFEEGDFIKFFGDFTDGSTQIFEARLETPRYGFDNGFKVFLNGMKNPEFSNQNLTKSYIDAVTDDVLEDITGIVEERAESGGFGLQTFGETEGSIPDVITVNYEDESIINILKDILERTKHDGYIDLENKFQLFTEVGQVNANEAAIQGQNILNITPFGKDTLKQRNKVRLYGAIVEDMLIIKSLETTTTSWDKEEVIKEGSSITLNDALQRASSAFTKLNEINQQGSVTCSALPTLRPGNRIPIRVPNANIEANYFLPQYTQNFSTLGGWTTTVNVNKLITDITSIHFEHKQKEKELKELDNPNDMKNTLIFLTMDNQNDIASLSGCVLSNGKLILTTGNDTGTMISNTFTNTNNFKLIELRGSANDDFILGPSIMEVSNNRGTTFETITNYRQLTSLSSTGKRGIVKVTIKSDTTYENPSLESIGLLVDT